jgi:uncharacterized phiE125 gp8 family phage protein
MKWKVTSEPIELPVSLAEAKDYLRVSGRAEDDLITSLIQSAVDYCQEVTEIAFMDQEITLVLDRFPAGRVISLPRANLLSVTSVSYRDGANVLQSFTDFTSDRYATPARIVNNTSIWPATADVANAVTIVYRAGFKETETAIYNPVPAAIKQAILMLVAHFYDNRAAVVVGSGIVAIEMKIAVESLLDKYRVMGL